MQKIDSNGSTYHLLIDKRTNRRILHVEGNIGNFEGEVHGDALRGPLSPQNAAALREKLAWLKPQPLGLATSFGFGDRLGLATAGHINALRETDVAPIFAQQSVRENSRTGRTPQSVIDDAMWAVFESNWRKPWGADADHVKGINDLSSFIDAGYSFYTIDPNENVDHAAHSDTLVELRRKAANLPWDSLATSLESLIGRYVGRTFRLAGINLDFDEEKLLRAAAKYGKAIGHTRAMSDFLLHNVSNLDLEVSVDETDTPTSIEPEAPDLRGTKTELTYGHPFITKRGILMKYGLDLKQPSALDLVSLGALIHRLDPGIIPFRKATQCSIHVSGGEFNVAANLADCFGLQTGVATGMVNYPVGSLIRERVRAMGVKPFYKYFEHNGVNGPNMATVYSDRGFGVRAPVVFYNPIQ